MYEYFNADEYTEKRIESGKFNLVQLDLEILKLSNSL